METQISLASGNLVLNPKQLETLRAAEDKKCIRYLCRHSRITAKNSICLVTHSDYGSITSHDKVRGTGMKAIY